MSFIATESPPSTESEPTVTNDGWFPSISPERLRAAARLDGTVTPDRLRAALLQAVHDVNHELAGFKAEQVAAGCGTLADVPGPSVTLGEGEGAQIIKARVTHYFAAVRAHVQAQLAERYRDFDSTGDGDKRADALDAVASNHWRDMRWSISSILGQSRVTVELI